MPEMIGFEMLKKGQNKEYSFNFSFCKSQKKKDIRAAIHKGDKDYLKKLINMNDLISDVKKKLLN
jgi:response regulator RpfG family c-di-GMP phosphodiesterase